uniref:Uncharacterized protein n=1 Tax=Strix occidentalis caurina TaxID=311401 RepID=A0A8D0FRN8_STROC
MPLKHPLPPTSQIPGLGDLAKGPHEVPSGCCRQWIKETESAYYRLAKQGDLRKHYTPATMKSSPAAYATPDWYSHCSSPPNTFVLNYVSSSPDYMIHRVFKADDHHGNSYKTRRGPFDFDMKSVWQQDAEDNENTETKKVGWRGTLGFCFVCRACEDTLGGPVGSCRREVVGHPSFSIAEAIFIL